MAKFIFKMQNILDIKSRLETQAKTEFSEAASRLAEQEDILRQLLVRRKQYESELKEMSENHLNIVEIKRKNESIKVMGELMKQQAVKVRMAQKNFDVARQKLNDAIQDRKIYEKLKENAFEQFKLEVNEEEKLEIDQLVSFTYNAKDED